MVIFAPVLWTSEHFFAIENPIHLSCFHYLRDVNDTFLIYIGMTRINHPVIGQPTGFQFLRFVTPVSALFFPDDSKISNILLGLPKMKIGIHFYPLTC